MAGSAGAAVAGDAEEGSARVRLADEGGAVLQGRSARRWHRLLRAEGVGASVLGVG